MTDRPASTRILSITDAAWLVRRNDDTVRRWVKEGLVTESGGKSILFKELVAFCAARGRASPLPEGLLDLSSDDAAELLALAKREAINASTTSDVGSQALSHPPFLPADDSSAYEYWRARAEAYRRALRERVAGAIHSRAESASADRALLAVLDEDERVVRDRPSPPV